MSHPNDLIESLENLGGRGRFIAGICLTIAGAVLTWVMWGAGFVWALSLFFLPTGIGLIFSGLAGMKRERAEQAQWERIRRDEESIVTALVEVKQRGGRTVPWLIKQGFSARKVRRYLLDCADDAPEF